jgi:opacity protein-like surface antigen
MNLTALSRRTKSLTIASLVAVSSLLGASIASAQSSNDGPIVPGQWTVTPFIGFGFSGDLDSGTGLLGVAGGFNYNSKVSVEGEFTLLPSPELNGLTEADATAWSLTGNLLYHFVTTHPFIPYAVAGIGVGHSGANGKDPLTLLPFDNSSTVFVANIGGGLERQFSDRLRFRGDLRYLFGGDLVPDYWRVSAGITFVLPHGR